VRDGHVSVQILWNRTGRGSVSWPHAAYCDAALGASRSDRWAPRGLLGLSAGEPAAVDYQIDTRYEGGAVAR
jgi:hypothetical protein